ncbi:CDC27 family protein [Lacinutrix gracilariae]|uniref:CDC27 family protein n=1 Tax=Lacinutrix gracilariae TaxID=1747198 RepID=A0ABW5JXR4_9FLAO
MKKLAITTLVLLLTINALFAQSNNEKAKSFYTKAESSYSSSNYTETIESLNSVEELLGKSKPIILNLKIKAYYQLKQYDEALNSLDKFYEVSLNADSELVDETLSYATKIEDALKKELELEEESRLVEIKNYEEKRRKALVHIEAEALNDFWTPLCPRCDGMRYEGDKICSRCNGKDIYSKTILYDKKHNFSKEHRRDIFIKNESLILEKINKKRYQHVLDKSLSDTLYVDNNNTRVDKKNAIFQKTFEKKSNGLYAIKYYKIEDEYLFMEVSYEVIPNEFIESIKTGLTIKYGPLGTKNESYYYYKNKLKQKTLNSWWLKKMSFEFYNNKDEKVFGSGDISKPEKLNISSSGRITSMEYKKKSKRGKFDNYRFRFDSKGNITSLYIINHKGKIINGYDFGK